MNTFTKQLLGLALVGMILGGCSQTATYEDADLTNELAAAEKAGFKLNPYSVGGNENAAMYEEGVCETSCITDQEDSWFIKSYEHVFDPVAPAKKLKIDVYNTPTQLIYDVYTENTSIKYLKIGDTFLINNTASTNYQHIVELGDFGVDWIGCEQYDATFYAYRNNLSGTGGGQFAEIISSYNAVPVCQSCDEETFSYEATKAGDDLVNILFTYDAATPLTDAEVKFTFPQIQDVSVDGFYTAPDEKVYTVNNNGNNTVFTWTGNIGCTNATATTFEFEVMADCNSSGKAQIWTSASVNGEEVKNENTPNIRFWCETGTIEQTNED